MDCSRYLDKWHVLTACKRNTESKLLHTGDSAEMGLRRGTTQKDQGQPTQEGDSFAELCPAFNIGESGVSCARDLHPIIEVSDSSFNTCTRSLLMEIVTSLELFSFYLRDAMYRVRLVSFCRQRVHDLQPIPNMRLEGEWLARLNLTVRYNSIVMEECSEQEPTMEKMEVVPMLFLLIFSSVLCCSGYRFQLEEGETGRFIYEISSGHHQYCTVCKTGNNDEQNRRTQQRECIDNNIKREMPNNESKPICKERDTDGRILSCGPLPAIDGLSWKTRSGRPIRNMSTVYEEYFPECPRMNILESNFSSIRCGEKLTWNVNPTEFRCLKGCGPLPDRFEWRMGNGSKAGNESLAGYTYIGLCRLEFKTPIIAHCGRDSIWHDDPSQVICPSEKCDEWYCSMEIQIVFALVMLLIPVVIASLYCVRVSKKYAKRSLIRKHGVKKKILADKWEPDIPTSDTESCNETTDTESTNQSTEESRKPMEHMEIPFCKQDENIKVFQTLRTGVNQEGILEFTVQRGELVYIATKEIMLNSNSFQIRRKDEVHYRGAAIYQFLHCIKEIELSDAGLYYWTTTESWPKRNAFLLRVEDRGQPDGLESINSSFHLSCDVQQDVLDYFSSISNMCLASPPSSLSTTKDELECKLKIDAIFRDMEDLRKQLCYCLDSSTSFQLRGCWRVIAKTFLNRTDAYISSVEWHRKGDPDNGPSNLILNDLCRANQNLSIGQLVANLPPNLDLLNTILRFHDDCYFCNRLLYETQQTEPKVF
ncbi:uncharacterized protein LOC133196161 [Saccostrea echinata]|uniref:uncharacterized protein LOC133196161 n=1 Tax=Saccostrea echinata TaxID=191078 RepID=UPI002A8200A9|nr:uncharacterized protein LOC133196161 [Saccostrea echinata]